MNDTFTVKRFAPLFLTVENIGPFQGRPYTVDFTTADHNPSNFFLLVAQNSLGKTTLLQTMAYLMETISFRYWKRGEGDEKRLRREELRSGHGRAQLDLLAEFQEAGQSQTIIYSLVIQKKGYDWLKKWTTDEIHLYGATSHAQHVFGQQIRNFTLGHCSIESKSFSSFMSSVAGTLPETPEADLLSAPTLLFFSDNRDIPLLVDPKERSISQPEDWEYRPVKRFGLDREWNHSPDNVLVWLQWLGDGRLERIQQMINDWVFKGTAKHLEGVRKQPPEAVVNNNGVKHRLDCLSGGERNLVQLCLRLGVYMTRNTLVLIDELDLHLHVRWQHHVLNLFKALVRDTPGLTVIATTHSVEIVSAFAEDLYEEGLRKGGQIIEWDNDRE